MKRHSLTTKNKDIQITTFYSGCKYRKTLAIVFRSELKYPAQLYLLSKINA